MDGPYFKTFLKLLKNNSLMGILTFWYALKKYFDCMLLAFWQITDMIEMAKNLLIFTWFIK